MDTLKFRPRHRLLTKQDYSAVFDQVDQRISKGPYLLLCRKNTLDHPRLGLIVRKKFLKRAVDRNSLKRLVRENFRTRQHQLENLDVVFMNRGSSEHKTEKEIKTLLSDIFESLARSYDSNKKSHDFNKKTHDSK